MEKHTGHQVADSFANTVVIICQNHSTYERHRDMFFNESSKPWNSDSAKNFSLLKMLRDHEATLRNENRREILEVSQDVKITQDLFY